MDVFDDGERLYARSVLPRLVEVTPGDRFQSGVAIKATAEGICVHPYLFRRICSNGAILALLLGSKALGDLGRWGRWAILGAIRSGIIDCCGPDVLSSAVPQLRNSITSNADRIISALPLLTRFSHTVSKQEMGRVVDRILRRSDRSRYGVANAITAEARDTVDPELRWELEVLGARIAIASPSLASRVPVGVE
jgi:hypothetical protein